MHDTCKTVLIKGADGPVRVNESDYNADQAEDGAKSMTLYKGKDEDGVTDPSNVQTANTVQVPSADNPAPVAPSAPAFAAPENPQTGPAAPTIASPNTRSIMKQGKKWQIVDENGERITAFPGLISEKGYDTEEEARHVLTLLPR